MTTQTLLDAGLCLPRYDTGGLGAVLPAAAGVLGVDVEGVGGPGSGAARAALGLPSATRVCVVLVDGLGSRILAERLGHAPTLRALSAAGRELVVGFPSTTAASLGVFGTGSVPGCTGMLGYTVRNPWTGRLANMVSWDGLGEPAQVQQQPTVFEAVAAAGVAVTSVGPRRFAGSGMTGAALRGAGYAAADSLGDRVDTTLRALRAPGLVYLYWGDIDKAGHHHGWRSAEWGDALSEFDRELGRLVRSLPRDTLVVLTADHGMIDVDPACRWDVAHDAALREGVDMVAGEPRATHVYVRAQGDSRAVAERWQNRLGAHAVVMTKEEAIGSGLFGPVAPHVLPAIGDVVVAATGRATVVDSASQTPASIGLVGVHGSLTPEEMTVPLLVAHG
ncbi:MAG: alkaline phosphatase family protein [Cellulomonadaceae bacterium]